MKKLILGLLFAVASCAGPAFAYTPPQTATAPITLSTSNVVACPTCLTTGSAVVNTFAGGTTGLLPSAATSGAITLTGTLVGANGGTGVVNTGKTITLGGNLTTSGAFATTLISTAATSVTLPTSGTIPNLTSAISPASVTSSGAVSGTTGVFSAGINSTAIGATTPSTGAFSTLSATGAVSGAGFTSLFASPPAIGGTAPSTGAFTSGTFSSTLSALGIASFGSTAQGSIDASGNFQTTGTINEISTTGNAVATFQGHQQSGGGSFLKLRDDTLGNYGYVGDNSAIQGGTSYNEFTITNPQATGSICIVSNGGGSSTANTGCDILDSGTNTVQLQKVTTGNMLCLDTNHAIGHCTAAVACTGTACTCTCTAN